MIPDSMKNGEIYIFGEIDDETVRPTISRLKYIHRHLPQDKPIRIFIYSSGGDLDAASAIIGEMELIKSSGRPIYTIGVGSVYSAAIFILAHGSRRFGYEYSSYMIHPCLYSVEENHKQNKEYVKFMDGYVNTFLVELALLCHKSDNKVELNKFMSNVDKGIWWSVEEAIENKLIESMWSINENNKQ